MTTKKKNDNPNLLKRNALIISIAFNIILTAMFLLLYVPTLAPPPPTADAFQLTATQLIATATEGAMTRIAGISIPQLTTEEEAALREKFLNEVEIELGFSHPVFEETVNELIASINQAIFYKNEYGFEFRIPETFIRSTDTTTVDGDEYIAVALVSNIEDYFQYKSFIFRSEGSSPELLAQSDGESEFDDRNQNGFPDIAFRTGTCCHSGINFYEIRSDRELVNLTETLNAEINEFVDLNADGILELQGTQQLFVPEGIPLNRVDEQYYGGLPRWFFWNGEEYEPYPVIAGE